MKKTVKKVLIYLAGCAIGLFLQLGVFIIPFFHSNMFGGVMGTIILSPTLLGFKIFEGPFYYFLCPDKDCPGYKDFGDVNIYILLVGFFFGMLIYGLLFSLILFYKKRWKNKSANNE